MVAITLRKIIPADVNLLFEIRCSVLENHQSRDELASLDITETTVAEMLASDDYLAYLAELDGYAVGLIMAAIAEGRFLACFIRPGYEKQGIGRALMQKTEAELQMLGVTQVWLSTGPGEQLRAVGFYEHLGWQRAGYLDDGQIRFEKVLGTQALNSG